MAVKNKIERRWKINNWDAAYEVAFNECGNLRALMNKPGVKYRFIREAYEGNVRVRWLNDIHENHILAERTVQNGQGLEIKEHIAELDWKSARSYFWRMFRSNSPYIYKIQCCVPHGQYTIDFDEVLGVPQFMFRTHNLYAGIKFQSVEEAMAFSDIPAWFGEEVTGQHEHSMSHIYDMIRTADEYTVFPVYNEDADEEDEGW